jgi:hypothetical protein
MPETTADVLVTLLFVILALMAALVAGLGARRRGLDGEAALRHGAMLFLGQLGVFVAAAGLGLAPVRARAAALALGAFGTLLEPPATEEA